MGFRVRRRRPQTTIDRLKGVCVQMLWTRLQIYIIATEVRELKWAHARKENAVTEMSMRIAANAIETHKLFVGEKKVTQFRVFLRHFLVCEK